MSIGFIGAGRAGSSLGIYFSNKGIKICGFYSNNFEDSKNAANKTNSIAFDNLYDICRLSDIIIISTPDDIISSVATKISVLEIDFKSKIFCHLSGAKSSDILKVLKSKGSSIASIHPVYTFATTESVPKDLIFVTEGSDKITSILNEVNIKTHKINENDKTLYHAAAVFASNYITSLAAISNNILESIGLPHIFNELILTAASEAVSKGPEKALTGPIARGDIETIVGHLNALKNNAELSVLYKYLGFEALKISNLDNETKSYLLKVLKGELTWEE